MKFTCLQEHLAKSLFLVERTVAKTSHLPTLSHLLLKTVQGVLELATTDLEIGVISWCPGKIEQEGGITVPARAFAGLVNTLPQDKIVLEVKNDMCLVQSGGVKASFKGLPIDDFPLIPKLENETPLTINAAALSGGLMQVMESTGGENTRPELGGVLFAVGPNTVTMVATDSFRLARAALYDVKTDGIHKTFFQDHTLIVPGKTVRELVRIIDTEDDPVSISIGENQIQFAQKSYQLVSRLIEGAYPRYEDIIPSQGVGVKTFDRHELAGALRRMAFFSGRLGRVEFVFEQEVCRMQSEDASLGSALEAVPTQGEGPEIKCAFNIRYLLDGVALLKGERVYFEYNTPQAPVVLHAGERERSLHIVMPMKVE